MSKPTAGQVSLDLPQSLSSALRQDPASFVDEMRWAAAVKWYEMRQISQAKAAEVAGLSRTEFLSALARLGASPCQYNAEGQRPRSPVANPARMVCVVAVTGPRGSSGVRRCTKTVPTALTVWMRSNDGYQLGSLRPAHPTDARCARAGRGTDPRSAPSPLSQPALSRAEPEGVGGD